MTWLELDSSRIIFDLRLAWLTLIKYLTLTWYSWLETWLKLETDDLKGLDCLKLNICVCFCSDEWSWMLWWSCHWSLCCRPCSLLISVIENIILESKLHYFLSNASRCHVNWHSCRLVGCQVCAHGAIITLSRFSKKLNVRSHYKNKRKYLILKSQVLSSHLSHF